MHLPLMLGALALSLTPPPPEPGPPEGGAEARATSVLADDYAPPFASEPVTLSKALTAAAEHNLDLAMGEADIEISEGAVLKALGAYDVQLTAELGGSVSEAPQRGSQFASNVGTRTVGGGVGFRRALETGGSVSLTLRTERMRTEQPADFTDPNGGTATLTGYAVVPSLELRHPLLKGAGLKVGRAEIDKAKIAVTAAEANRQAIAQGLARDLIGAYWDLLFAHRNLVNKQRSMGQVQRQLDRTHRLVRAGRRARSDEKSVRQALAAREAEVLSAENGVLEASLVVRKLMGQKLSERDVLGVVPSTDPVVRPRRVIVRDEIKRALKVNPQIRAVELGLASYRIDELVAANARLPQLDVAGSFTPQGRSIDTLGNAMTGERGTSATWGGAFGNIFNNNVSQDGLLADWTLQGSMTLTWDVQNRGAKGARQQAKAQMGKARRQLEKTRQDVTAGIITAANRLRTAGKTIEVADLSYELAQDNLQAEQARFDLGRATNFEVLLRLDEVDEAATKALDAQIGYLRALADLQALNGEILPAYGLDKRRRG